MILFAVFDITPFPLMNRIFLRQVDIFQSLTPTRDHLIKTTKNLLMMMILLRRAILYVHLVRNRQSSVHLKLRMLVLRVLINQPGNGIKADQLDNIIQNPFPGKILMADYFVWSVKNANLPLFVGFVKLVCVQEEARQKIVGIVSIFVKNSEFKNWILSQYGLYLTI